MRQYDVWIDEVHRLPKTFLRDADTWKARCVLEFYEDTQVFSGYELPHIGQITLLLTETQAGRPRLSFEETWQNVMVARSHQGPWALAHANGPFVIEWDTTYWLSNALSHSIMRVRAELNDFPRVCALLAIENIEDVGQVGLDERGQYRELIGTVRALNTTKQQRRALPPVPVMNQHYRDTIQRERDAVRALQDCEENLGISLADLRRREEGRGGGAGR